MVTKLFLCILSIISAFVVALCSKSAEVMAECISASIACFSFILALVSVFAAYNEYQKKQKFERCDVLMRYNERYEESSYIKNAINYLNKEANKDSVNNGQNISQKSNLTICDKEMFLRFYEELDYMIEVGYLDRELVANYFAYYFFKAWSCDEFWSGLGENEEMKPEDIKDSYEWRKSKSFYSKMIKTRFGKNYEMSHNQ